MTTSCEETSRSAAVAGSVAEPPASGGAEHRIGVGLVAAMGGTIALAPLTIDTYLPALPSIQAGLRSTPAAVQLTLTGTLVGLAAGQLLIGPWSDAAGRRRPLLAGMGLHVLASLLCMIAPSVLLLGAARFLQGLGAAAAVVVTTAMVGDIAAGRRAAVLLSRLMLVMGAAPILAPALGGQLLRLASWRGIFGTLAVLGLALIVVAVLALPETLPAERRLRGGHRRTVQEYGVLLRDPVFVGLVLVIGLAMGALFGYVAGSAFVYQEQFGLSVQQFGLAFGAGSVALIAATQLNAALLDRFTPQQLVLSGLTAGTAGGVLLLAAALTGFGGLAGVIVPMWVVLGAAGLTLPNAPALALSRHREAAGAAAALMGAAQFGIAALAPAIEGAIGTDATAMGVVIGSCLGLALLVLLVLVRPWRLQLDAEAPVEAAVGV